MRTVCKSKFPSRTNRVFMVKNRGRLTVKSNLTLDSFEQSFRV